MKNLRGIVAHIAAGLAGVAVVSGADAGVVARFQERLATGGAQYIGVPLEEPNTLAMIVLTPGDPNGQLNSGLITGSADWSWSWRKWVKTAAVGLGAVAGGTAAALAAVPTT